MRETADGARFYTSQDVNHERVRVIARDAAHRERPYPLAWLGLSGWKYLIRERPQPAAHVYGPHRPEDEPAYTPVPVMVRWHWQHVEIDDRVRRQRAQINRLAHERNSR